MIKSVIIFLENNGLTCWCGNVYLHYGDFKMVFLFFKRSFFVILLNLIIVIPFTINGQNIALGGKEIRSFILPSVLKQGSDVRPREILFTAKYPGDIEIDVSWVPDGKKLTVTLYDQNGIPLISKKDESPVHIIHKYTQVHFEKAKIMGNVFRVVISQSPFKSINGSVEISTPDKKVIEEGDVVNNRGPYGTFIEGEEKEEGDEGEKEERPEG